MQLVNKVCLVTGGSKGIGGATAVALAEQGARVAIVARTIDDEATKLRSRLGAHALALSADVARPGDLTRAVEETVRTLGPVDVLIHAAGGAINGGLLGITPEQWQAAFDVHVHPIFHLCRAVIPTMNEKREWAIVLVSSAAGI